MLHDEELYFSDLLNEQQEAVDRYRRYRTWLLGAGGAIVIGALAWMLLEYFQKDSAMDAFLKAFIPLGGGFITAATSALPIKEIVNRNEKIVTYRRLLEIVRRLKASTAADPEEVAMIRARMSSIVDTVVKGC